MHTAPSLRHVEEGMKVYDRERHEIGTVDYVRFGEDDPTTPEIEAASLSAEPETEHSLLDDVARAFVGDELPDEIRQRLLQQGFVRLDAAGLFSADRYIAADQIASVSEEGLTLNVSKDELIKKH